MDLLYSFNDLYCQSNQVVQDTVRSEKSISFTSEIYQIAGEYLCHMTPSKHMVLP